MDGVTQTRTASSHTCAWCGWEFTVNRRGRPKKYCSQSCKQRAYEQRNRVSGTDIPAQAVIIQPERAAALRDSLFELRCAAEDVAIASAEGAESTEIQELCRELVDLARTIEKLR